MAHMNKEQSIRERAYVIWEQLGRPHGQDLDNWLEAERQVLGHKGASGKALAAARSASTKAMQKANASHTGKVTRGKK